jgi:ABC-type polysaccharide/polyol phosphate transport system ATPase subunit
MHAIDIDHATKIYRRYGRRRQFATLKSALLSGSLITDLKPAETFTALQDVSLRVATGETVGVIGPNGSGKSTLLKLVAGITKPTSGTVNVKGRISALIELGAGFHPEISGRENVFINGIMLGLSKREVLQKFEEIVEFAELEEFIDAPVKTYSSGMYARLGFAVAIHVNPDVLLVDEILAVGDQGFTHKCLDKFAEFRRRGKTILLVTHSLSLVERFCDDAVWLDSGLIKAVGDPKRVIDAYLSHVESQEEQQLEADDIKTRKMTETSSEPLTTGEVSMDDMFQVAEGRWGSREVEILDVTLVGDDGKSAHVFHSGDRMSVRLHINAEKPVSDFVFGVGLFNADGVCCYGTNTDLEQLVSKEIDGEGTVDFTIDSLDLVAGTYKLDVAVHKRDGYPYDYHRLLYTFRMKSRTNDVGIYRPRHKWKFPSNVRFSGPLE